MWPWGQEPAELTHYQAATYLFTEPGVNTDMTLSGKGPLLGWG